jgi:hypothetical protein
VADTPAAPSTDCSSLFLVNRLLGKKSQIISGFVFIYIYSLDLRELIANHKDFIFQLYILYIFYRVLVFTIRA